MPVYKICYFNARGLGEMLRIMFAEAGVSFEDVRYAGEEWPKHKPDMLFNQMPVLFVDGEQIAHSRAALRYLAREFKMDGGDSLTAAKMDMWIEVFVEAFMKMPFAEKDEKIKAEKTAQVWKEIIKPRLSKLEATIKGLYVFGDKPTAFDILTYVFLDNSVKKQKDCLDEFPKIKAIVGAIAARPAIAKWIAERPQTEN